MHDTKKPNIIEDLLPTAEPEIKVVESSPFDPLFLCKLHFSSNHVIGSIPSNSFPLPGCLLFVILVFFISHMICMSLVQTLAFNQQIRNLVSNAVHNDLYAMAEMLLSGPGFVGDSPACPKSTT